MRRKPDVELLEADFETLLEIDEELAVIRQIGHSNKNADQLVAVRLHLIAPLPLDILRLAGIRPELLLQFRQRRGNEIRRYGITVVESRRNQNLIAAVHDKSADVHFRA